MQEDVDMWTNPQQSEPIHYIIEKSQSFSNASFVLNINDKDRYIRIDKVVLEIFQVGKAIRNLTAEIPLTYLLSEKTEFSPISTSGWFNNCDFIELSLK